MKNNTTIHRFRSYLENLGYSKTSVQMLPDLVGDFFGFTAKELGDIEQKDITAFYNYLKERPHKRRPGGLSEQYIHHHVYALKTFFAWLEQKGEIHLNPISSLDFPQPKSKAREILTLEEVRELYHQTQTRKERAIVSLYYGCGLRRTEGVKLDLKDIHFRSNMLYVREGKNKKRRAVPMGEKVRQDLYNYAVGERKAKGGESAFLCNHHGVRLSAVRINDKVKELVQRAGIQKEITLHSLRHSIATHLLESGLPVEYVRDFLGHKHLESTQIYTRIRNKQLWAVSHYGQLNTNDYE